MIFGLFRLETQFGDDEQPIPPTLGPIIGPKQQEHVHIYHDECAVHANDYKQDYWLQAGEQVLKKKERGQVMVISDFITPAMPTCHLELSEEQLEAQQLIPKSQQLVEKARKIIYPSSKAGGDPWWNMDQMIDQVSMDHSTWVQYINHILDKGYNQTS